MSSNKAPSTPHYSEDPSRFPMEGGCCCGHVRYRLERAPLVTQCCHCTSCQRETGTAFAINVLIEPSYFTVLPSAPPTLPARRGAPDVFPSAGPLPPPAPAPSSPNSNSNSDGPFLRTMLPQESGEGQITTHCPVCFSAVWTQYGGSGRRLLFVRGGTLDRAWLITPDVHLYVRSKRDFIVLNDGIPQFEEFYNRKNVWRADSLERFERVMLKKEAE